VAGRTRVDPALEGDSRSGADPLGAAFLVVAVPEACAFRQPS
jgi:hypothetical protein